MIRSMTGFGKGEVRFQKSILALELSTVNRKQLELRINLPRELAAFESIIRQELTARLSRGSVTARLTLTAEAGSPLGPRINTQLLEEMLGTIQNFCAAHPELDKPSISTLLTLPGVMETAPPEGDNPELQEALRTVTREAVDRLLAMRTTEGKSLQTDLENRLTLLEQMVEEIKPAAAAVPAQLKQKLLDKIAAENLLPDPNDERLLKEVLFYADKADVTEELTRLDSHFKQFRTFIASADPTGRSLDFLLQEMFREVTTLGNKVGSGAITPIIVAAKAELEKLREQVQNVE